MKAKVFVALLGACALLPTVSSATTYTYTPTSGDIVPSFFFTTSLSGAALENLPPGTSILGTLSVMTFNPVPATDTGGFPIGGPLGSPYLNPTSGQVLIGTNGVGQITSWDIAENFFASYPANNVSCEYSGSTITGGNSLVLTNASDGFVCRDGATSLAGTFTAEADVATTPLPAALPLFATGLSALGLFGWRRKKKAAALAA